MYHPEAEPSYGDGLNTQNTWTVEETLSTYGQNIVERSFQFAVRNVALYTFLQKHSDSAGKTLATKLLRCTTSIGANVDDAQIAESKTDFIYKMKSAREEAHESLYWLRLLRTAGILDSQKSNSIFQEADEILRVLSKIIINAQANVKHIR